MRAAWSRWLVALGPWLAVAAAARADHLARAQPAAPAAVAPLVDPCVDGSDAACTRRALDGFYAALAATEAGTASHPVRISYLGDSITAGDHIEQRLRSVLGDRFGDGGPGFVRVVPPRGCADLDLQRRWSGSWRVHGVAGPWSADHLLGFAGGSAEAYGGRARLTPRSPVVTHAEVFYLAQPGGGTLDVTVDGDAALTVATAETTKQAGFATVPVTGTLGALGLIARGRVRLFGVVLEADRGVVVDNLGVQNATAGHWAATAAASWQEQIAHRAPDLFVIMVGDNEANWLAGRSLRDYDKVMAALLAPVRAAGPDASCLVISPLDRVDFSRRGLPPRAAIPSMVEAQRTAALAAGCGFWDAYAWMGGAGSSRNWFRRGWVINDFTHPTSAGANRIADALAAGLLDGYARYQAR